MNEFAKICNIIFPVFFAIGLGYFLKTKSFISQNSIDELSKIVFYIAIPALLFRNIARISLFETSEFRSIAAAIFVSLITTFGVYWFAGKSSPARRGVFAQGANRSNMVFIGLPVVAFTFGEKILGSAALFIGCMAPVYNFLSILVLLLPHQTGNRWRILTKTGLNMVTNPVILSCMIGAAFSLLNIPTPILVDRILETTARISLPLALLIVGAGINFKYLKADLRPACYIAIVKLLILPGLLYALLVNLQITGKDLFYPVILLATPTAPASNVVAHAMKGDSQLSSTIVICTTIASLFSLSFWVAILLARGT